MRTSWIVNGTGTTVDPGDRGLAYGDGLFETMAVIDGRIRHFELHMARLADGCRRLQISLPDRDAIAADFETLLSDESPAVAKLIVTRGIGARGYSPGPATQPTRIQGIHPWPDYPDSHYADGVAVRSCQLRLGENPALAGIKHLNRLEQVVASMEWQNGPWEEGLLCNTSGSVVGGTRSNVFSVRGDTLLTPSVERCGVKGVMRQTVIETAQELGLQVTEDEFPPQQLYDCDELFLTNAIFGVWPVRRLDERQFEPGAITKKLMHALDTPTRA
jgi:4-amino-4-deoxychorismate lyase